MKRLSLEEWKKCRLLYWSPIKERGHPTHCIYQDLLRNKTVGQMIDVLKVEKEYLNSDLYMFNLYTCSVEYEFREGIVNWTCPDRSRNVKKYMGETIEDLHNFYRGKRVLDGLELEMFLKKKPLSMSGNTISDGLHRSFAMMGRIIHGKPYVPFFVR